MTRFAGRTCRKQHVERSQGSPSRIGETAGNWDVPNMHAGIAIRRKVRRRALRFIPSLAEGFILSWPKDFAQGKISSSDILVRKEGVEPPRPFGHKILSLARLPVPPLPQWSKLLNCSTLFRLRFFRLLDCN